MDLLAYKYDLREMMMKSWCFKVGLPTSQQDRLSAFADHESYRANFGYPLSPVDMTWLGAMTGGAQEYYRLLEVRVGGWMRGWLGGWLGSFLEGWSGVRWMGEWVGGWMERRGPGLGGGGPGL